MTNIKYYIERLVEHPSSKIVISFIGTVLVTVFGQMNAALGSFLMLLALDYITGLYKSYRKGILSSWLSRKGGGKILTYAVVIAVAHLVEQSGFDGLRSFAIFWAGATEGISLLENLDALGIYIPDFLRDKLLQTKKKKFGDYDENK